MRRALALLMALFLTLGAVAPGTVWAEASPAAEEATAAPQETTEVAEETTEAAAEMTEAASEVPEEVTEAPEEVTEAPTEEEGVTAAPDTTEPEKLEEIEELLDFSQGSEATLTGDGTQESPYLLTTEADLRTLDAWVTEGDERAKGCFRMENDIVITGTWDGIGDKDTPFEGDFDGGSHQITIPQGGMALFARTRGAVIHDLKLYGPKIQDYGLVSHYVVDLGAEYYAKFYRVTLVKGTQTLYSGFIGGYASGQDRLLFEDCTVESGVTIGYDKKQSHIGSLAGEFNGFVKNCTSGAKVYGKDWVGGLVGNKGQSMGDCSIEGSTFTGTVSATGNYAGGILGGGYAGTGWGLVTAPNAKGVIIKDCASSGKIFGTNGVGGILGAEACVQQCWDNGICYIQDNRFTGFVTATGKYAGGIIGFMQSLNANMVITGNYYKNAAEGIGAVAQVDTSAVPNGFRDGTYYYDTSKYVSDGNGGVASYEDEINCVALEQYIELSTIGKAATGQNRAVSKPNMNRADDPLGVDKNKLCYTENVAPANVTGLSLEGTCKTEYTQGEELDLSGLTLVVRWSDGTETRVSAENATVSGYDANTPGEQTVRLRYEGQEVRFTVTVTPKSTDITVSVTILGDSHHSDPNANGGPHGLAKGGLTTWASETVTSNTKNTVWDVLQKVAKDAGLTMDADSNNSYGTVYVRGVNGLSEFDNGKNSGWMYTVNGKHPEVGVSARYLKDGDEIIFHYTDDYTYEEGGSNYGKTDVEAKKVIGLIKKIGTVTDTEECWQKIKAARTAYNALSAEAKKLVTNYSVLEAAELKYQKLQINLLSVKELVSGMSTDLKVLDANGKALDRNEINWTLGSPEDEIYATISQTGTVKAKAVLEKRDVTFVGILKGDYEGTVTHTITILPKVTQIEIVKDGENVTGKTLSMNAIVGENLILSANIYPEDAVQEITWRSSNGNIAQIDENGFVTFAGRTGTVTITAASASGSNVAATVTLQVGIFAQTVTIEDPISSTLRSGASLTLRAETYPIKPTVSGVRFQLVDPADNAYVTLSGSGKVTAKAVKEPHNVDIVAISKDAAAVESNVVTLTILPKSIQSLILKSEGEYVTSGKIVRNVGDTLRLGAYLLDTDEGTEEEQPVAWTSSNARVASIDKNGDVTCLKKGTVKLTAAADSKIKATVTLQVTNLVSSITIVPKSPSDWLEVASGKTLNLKAAVVPSDATQKAVIWSIIEGDGYAKISSSGTITANKGLTAPVTIVVRAVAKDGGNAEGINTVTIYPIAQGVTISDADYERTASSLVWDMAEEATVQFTSRVYPANAMQSVSWKSSNVRVASVDETGMVTCHKTGSVTITATAMDGSGKKASFKLNIVKRMKHLSLMNNLTVEGGKSLQLKAVMDPVDATNKKLIWSVSKNFVGAKISSSGRLTTKKVTEATTVTVTVSSTDGSGLTKTCSVTITPVVKK